MSSDTLEAEIETGDWSVDSVLGDQSTVLEFGLLVSIAENNAGQSPFANHRPTRRAMVGDKVVIESGELQSSRWRRFKAFFVESLTRKPTLTVMPGRHIAWPTLQH